MQSMMDDNSNVMSDYRVESEYCIKIDASLSILLVT